MLHGFFNYFRALIRSPRQKSPQILIYLLGMAVFAVSVYFGIASMNFVALTLAFLAGFVYFAGVLAGAYTFNCTPNLVLLVPVTPRKGLLYRFLSVLLLFIIAIVIVIAFLLAISIITGIIILIAEAASGGVGNESSGEVIEEEVEIISSMGVHGGIFSAAYFVFMYSMGMVAGFIKTAKIRNIVAGCLCAAVLVGMLLMGNPFIQESYDKMAVPWLCTVLCCLSAAAALGTAIYMGVKQVNKSY